MAKITEVSAAPPVPQAPSPLIYPFHILFASTRDACIAPLVHPGTALDESDLRGGGKIACSVSQCPEACACWPREHDSTGSPSTGRHNPTAPHATVDVAGTVQPSTRREHRHGITLCARSPFRYRAILAGRDRGRAEQRRRQDGRRERNSKGEQRSSARLNALAQDTRHLSAATADG